VKTSPIKSPIKSPSLTSSSPGTANRTKPDQPDHALIASHMQPYASHMGDMASHMASQMPTKSSE
jgi:hypothetical protein